MPGLDPKLFVDITEDVLSEYTCGICLHVYSNPKFTSCCRQMYCNDCITQWLNQNSKCPNDRQRLTSSQLLLPPRSLTNLMNKLKVKCRFESNGCTQVMQLSNVAKHETSCMYDTSKLCNECGQQQGSQHNCEENLKKQMNLLTKEMILLKNKIKDLSYNEFQLKNEVKNLRENNRKLTDEVQHFRQNRRPDHELQTLTDRTKLKIISSTMTKDMEIFVINEFEMALNYNKNNNDISSIMVRHLRNAMKAKYGSDWDSWVTFVQCFDCLSSFYISSPKNAIYFSWGPFYVNLMQD
ncbi:E3 ubiquitin-protein ligase NRDP1-like [Oppia nitens]|uniref:E3 ubiquitin-protein ligase NRDP1-like n=1 Tax=Oppia nitens TaxID=1686743 RepID=UPI0023DC7651|nr:E3 ubiquitin-protein ligase NRDP1-like [Oppia nitens]